MDRQPFLHGLLVQLSAPTQAWCGPDGELRAGGVLGVFHADVRVLASAELTMRGETLETVAVGEDDDGLRVVQLARQLDGPGADPETRVERVRSLGPGWVAEEILVSRAGSADAIELDVVLELTSDGLTMDEAKSGREGTLRAGMHGNGRTGWALDSGVDVRVDAPGAHVDITPVGAVRLAWRASAAAREPARLAWRIDVEDPGGVVGPPARAEVEWSIPEVTSSDPRLARFLDRSLRDLAGLRMSTTAVPEEVFLAAGVPWFLTLFGRDSLWAARMLLPLGTELAAGTLRTLAHFQGERTDIESAEQPGKIPHELRRAAQEVDGGDFYLPPLYYGTIDATALWIVLLHDAWRWGMADSEVEALLGPLESALTWLVDHGDADGDGVLEYVDASGRGLANQGWKDSGDSVQWRDGRLATGPIALAEVQGYAFEAAIGGAAILEHFGTGDPARWRAWAQRLAGRFREAFWVAGPEGRFPAIALDASKRPVDSLSSNIGHLLGTGLLDAGEEREVVAALSGAWIDSGYGLRTMSTSERGYWPLSYHGGSVWPHDTAIVLAGMAKAGFREESARLAEGLLAAADGFDFRLPELYGGDDRSEVARVVPYPAACRPQAWSAASAVVILSSALGLRADVPRGELHVFPDPPVALGSDERLSVHGLRVAGAPLDIDVADGEVRVSTRASLRVVHGSGA